MPGLLGGKRTLNLIYTAGEKNRTASAGRLKNPYAPTYTATNTAAFIQEKVASRQPGVPVLPATVSAAAAL
jgi:hypothetical protein